MNWKEHCKQRDEEFEKIYPKEVGVSGGVYFTMRDAREILSALHQERMKTLEWAQENHSDGYHTFNELYEHRFALFAVLCGRTFSSWKSKLHSDGTMYDGWFIAGVETPKGQATYHMPLSWWDKFKCDEVEKAPEWDGHTPKDVIERLGSLLDEAMGK